MSTGRTRRIGLTLAILGSTALGVVAAAAEPDYVEVTESEAAPKGVSPPQLPADVRQRFAGQTLTVAYEVYVSPDGQVAKVDVVTSVPEIDQTVTAWLTRFTYTTQNRPIRFPVKLTFTLAPAGYKAPPPHMPPMMRTSGDYPRLPDEVKRRNVGKQLVGVYIVSIDRDGHVTAVEPKVSIPGADAAIVATVKAWRYNAGGVPVRRAERFVFDVVEPRFR